ncbi:type III toxin-antitoxin system ToxN/AbiQ family toxin [Paenibacillus sp. MAHUQ-46]|uniref:Type III toxin-antitoxin system ToxN/AbiQ family toxin n=1 Tax=Paenibacillus roseus TaxID=2798579 RepID=A0A934MP30_9BACL|nr:type III toxin-antitoxin system ToxN/AbiQ family toxin [Paenibacillus roseus]
MHLNNMFPIIQTEIERMDFSFEEIHYKALLEKEYRFIVEHQEALRKRAYELYQAVLKGDAFYSRVSNDFVQLESNYRNFNK